jgi:hypothetical protein
LPDPEVVDPSTDVLFGHAKDHGGVACFVGSATFVADFALNLQRRQRPCVMRGTIKRARGNNLFVVQILAAVCCDSVGPDPKLGLHPASERDTLGKWEAIG